MGLFLGLFGLLWASLGLSGLRWLGLSWASPGPLLGLGLLLGFSWAFPVPLLSLGLVWDSPGLCWASPGPLLSFGSVWASFRLLLGLSWVAVAAAARCEIWAVTEGHSMIWVLGWWG